MREVERIDRTRWIGWASTSRPISAPHRAPVAHRRRLRFAHQGSAEAEAYDDAAAARVAVTVFGTTSRAGHVDLSGLSGPCTVRGRRGLLQNAVLNLCLNAHDAIGANGRIAIAGAVRELDAASCARLLPYRIAPGRFVALTVTDDGCGMTPEVLKRCFTPFSTTKGEHGTGLGLASVHTAALEHAGG